MGRSGRADRAGWARRPDLGRCAGGRNCGGGSLRPNLRRSGNCRSGNGRGCGHSGSGRQRCRRFRRLHNGRHLGHGALRNIRGLGRCFYGGIGRNFSGGGSCFGRLRCRRHGPAHEIFGRAKVESERHF